MDGEEGQEQQRRVYSIGHPTQNPSLEPGEIWTGYHLQGQGFQRDVGQKGSGACASLLPYENVRLASQRPYTRG